MPAARFRYCHRALTTHPETPAPPTPSDDSDHRPLRFPEAFAFLGSGSLLVLEIVAGRLIAPSVGVSLYTWTAVIGVVLAGITIGNYLGGRLADQRPSRTVLSLIYLGASAASALILVF